MEHVFNFVVLVFRIARFFGYIGIFVDVFICLFKVPRMLWKFATFTVYSSSSCFLTTGFIKIGNATV